MIIRVDVLPPTTLGAAGPFDVDDEITEVANRRGIPPQWIKGHVMKEADKIGLPGTFFWRRDTFRYEPFSSDLAEVSRSDTLRARAPYERYRLATQNNDPSPSGLARGISLDVPDDVSFRDALSINRGGSRRRIVTSANSAVNDNDVTVREIVDANPGQRYDMQNAAAYAAANAARAAGNDTLDFNAQTTLASSYGLLQQLYCNAVRYSRWKDPFGPGIADIHPRFLVDSAANLQAGDGSMHVATVQLLYQLDNASSGVYQTVFGVAPYRIDQFDSFADFKSKWQTALQFYNHYQLGYAASVLSLADAYTPSRVDAGIQP